MNALACRKETIALHGRSVCLHHWSILKANNFRTIYPDFEVVEPLPNVSFPINRNWAGNIRVNRTGHQNDTLFFWGFEREEGSLTAPAHGGSNEPWAIWLNGG